MLAETSGLRRDILHILHTEGELSGVGVASELEARDHGGVNTGSVYAGLERLISRGLVEWESRSGRENEYRLTGMAVAGLEDDWRMQE